MQGAFSTTVRCRHSGCPCSCDRSQDLRFAWRGLSRAKGFAAAAVLTMAVGVGGTSAMLRSSRACCYALPVPDQDRLVVAWKALPSAGAQAVARSGVPSSTPPLARAGTLAAVGGVSYYGTWPENATGVVDDVHHHRARHGCVLRCARRPAGARPDPQSRDDVEGAEPVIMITHGLWQQQPAARATRSGAASASTMLAGSPSSA